MRQKFGPRIVRSVLQKSEVLRLRATGMSCARIGAQLKPPVSRQRVWKIASTAEREALEAAREMERAGPEEFHRRIVARIYSDLRKLEARLPDLRAAQALLKIACMISRVAAHD